MGRDIHMDIVNQYGHIIYTNIIDIRNYTWFEQISDNKNCDVLYQDFPVKCGFPQSDCDLSCIQQRLSDSTLHYTNYYFSIADFKKWFNKYLPQEKAGWVTTYEKWLYDTKGILPDAREVLTESDIIEDMHFITFNDFNDLSAQLFKFFVDNKIEDSAFAIYYFDC